MHANGNAMSKPVKKKCNEKKDDDSPVTNIDKSQLNMNRTAKSIVPTIQEPKKTIPKESARFISLSEYHENKRKKTTS